MRTILYNLLLYFSRILLPLASLFSSKVKKYYVGHINLLNRIKINLESNSSPLFWVHCSSVGEFEQGLPVIELLKQEHPTWKVVVTFFSPSGYEAVNHSIIDYKFYFPYDTKTNASTFLEIVKPSMVLFIKYEYWYHFLNELNKRHIPIFSVSSIFRPTQTFFKPWGSWNRNMLQKFTYFMVQDKTSLQLLASIGLTNVKITGDTRFDRVLKIREDTQSFPEINTFINGKRVGVIGSLRSEDDDIILPFINSNPHYKYIIAPHDISEKHIVKIEEAIQSTVRYSLLKEDDLDKKVLIIDSIGKLSKLYRLANFAYVGGGFSDGIHNILEPAVYNIPVFFGNKYFKKYKEATDLITLNAAFPISSTQDFISQLKKMDDKVVLNEVKSNIANYVELNKGAAIKVVQLINQLDKK